MIRTILLFVFLTSIVQAQTDSLMIDEEIIVLGTRMKQSRQNTPRDVRVIDRKELVASGARSLDEAFQLLGGIEVQTRGPYGTQADISMRGSTFNQVLVLIDGQAINDPLTGHFSSNIPVAMNDVRRIEVIRGPSSAIYGPNAVGGVINIITQFSDPENMDLALKGHYNFGDYGLRQYGFGGDVPLGKLQLFAHHSQTDADGPEHLGDTTGASQFLDVRTTTFGLGWNPVDDFKVALRAGLDRRDFDARYYYTRSTADRSTETVDRTWVQGRVTAQMEDNIIELNTSYSETDDVFRFLPTIPANEHTTGILDNRLEWKRRWGKWSTNVGGQAQFRTIESNDRGNHAEEQFGFFAIAGTQWTPHLSTQASFRMDYQEVYGWQALPQLGVNYLRKGWKYFGNVGRSVRAGDFTERFIGFGRTTMLSSGRNLGNPNLQTENAWTVEGGVGYTKWSKAEVSASVFYRNSSDLIDFVVTPTAEIEDNRLLDPNGSYFYTRNIAELQTIGLELMGRYATDLPYDFDLSLEGNISWIQSDNDEDEVSKYLANHAGIFAGFSTQLSWREVSLVLNGIYKNRDFEEALAINAELTDQYFLMNARVNFELLSWVNLYGQMHNVMDTEYADVLGARMPGRWWSAGFRIGF